MGLISAWTVSLLMLTGAAEVQAAQASAPAAARPSGSKDERIAQAFANYEKQRFDAAALEFEGLWQEFREPRFLFNAAVSRVGARHHAHAVAYLSEYVGTAGVTDADRAEAEAQRTASLRETVSTRVLIDGPAEPGEIEFAVEHVQKLAADIRPPLVFAATQTAGATRSRVVDLDPGEWKVRIELAGYQPIEQVVRVTAGAQPEVRVALVRAPQQGGARAGLPERVRTRYVLGASVTGGLVLAGGVGVLVVGQVRYGQSFATPVGECAQDQLDCRTALASSGALRSVGAGLLGAGVGAAVAGVSGLVRASDRRRTAWIAESALGGAAALGGAVWAGLSVVRMSAANSRADLSWSDSANQAAVDRFATGYTAGAAVLGFGAGMLAGGVGGLVLERAYRKAPGPVAGRRLEVGGGVSPAWSGVVVSGRF